ncbi:hypothetical protein [Saccharopolyspora taberi]|uniref:Uncharacterized protein n=1 Tax=Saccharopolyspora taberi TaxID=60895 RepID=A0ABN3VHL1_9PSEU
MILELTWQIPSGATGKLTIEMGSGQTGVRPLALTLADISGLGLVSRLAFAASDLFRSAVRR